MVAAIMVATIMLILPGCTQVKRYMPKPAPEELTPSPRYLDFDTIKIPGDMKRVGKDTHITNNYGRLVIHGGLTGASLSGYFISQMPHDKWTFLNEYRYGKNIRIFFKKTASTDTPPCLASIDISENPLDTRVEIWLIPIDRH